MGSKNRNESLTTSCQSEMIVPNVIDMTGPISGETSIAATMLDAGIAIKILYLGRS